VVANILIGNKEGSLIGRLFGQEDSFARNELYDCGETLIFGSKSYPNALTNLRVSLSPDICF
jgi:hypothetical protein